MNGIQTLKQEHENILRMLEVIHNVSLNGLRNRDVNIQDLKEIVTFIRKYADKSHHDKEEKYLFKAMTDSLGITGENLVRHGMLVEHDLARLYVSELDAALDARLEKSSDENLLQILVAAGSYRQLLKRHITKEDTVLFPYGEKNLPLDLAQQVDDAMAIFEQDPEKAAIRDEQLQVLNMLEEKYPSNTSNYNG